MGTLSSNFDTASLILSTNLRFCFPFLNFSSSAGVSETWVSSTRNRILSPHIFPPILSISFFIYCLQYIYFLFLPFLILSSNFNTASLTISFHLRLFFHDTIFLNISYFLFSTICSPLSLSFNNIFPFCFFFYSPIFHFSSSAPLQCHITINIGPTCLLLFQVNFSGLHKPITNVVIITNNVISQLQ